MRYLVRGRVKPGRGKDLLRAIRDRSLGRGSVAGDEYLCDMKRACLGADGTVRWVEVCFCPTPLAEERAYWEEYFELLSVKDAHARRNCRDWNGTEPWACCECDCTERLEAKLQSRGQPFIESLEPEIFSTIARPLIPVVVAQNEVDRFVDVPGQDSERLGQPPGVGNVAGQAPP